MTENPTGGPSRDSGSTGSFPANPKPSPPAESDPGGASWSGDRLVKFLLDRDQGHMEAQKQQWEAQEKQQRELIGIFEDQLHSLRLRSETLGRKAGAGPDVVFTADAC